MLLCWKNIWQTRQHFLEARIDVLFCYEISRTKHELPDKILQNYYNWDNISFSWLEVTCSFTSVDLPVNANTFKTYTEFTSIVIFAKASWLRNFTQSFAALPMLFKCFYSTCLWRSLDSFYNDILGSWYFSKDSQRKTESWKSLRVNRWIFLCDLCDFTVGQHFMLRLLMHQSDENLFKWWINSRFSPFFGCCQMAWLWGEG